MRHFFAVPDLVFVRWSSTNKSERLRIWCSLRHDICRTTSSAWLALPAWKLLSPRCVRRHAINFTRSPPNFSTSARLQITLPKADKYGLPRVLVFCDGGTKPVLKAMTTEYRRRLLVAEIRKNRKNQALIKRYKVRAHVNTTWHTYALRSFAGKEVSHHIGGCCWRHYRFIYQTMDGQQIEEFSLWYLICVDAVISARVFICCMGIAGVALKHPVKGPRKRQQEKEL